MTLRWIFFDAGNTLIGLDTDRVVEALRTEGLDITESALARAEAACRRDLDAVILERWHAGAVPKTGWVEQRVWHEYWRQVLLTCGADSRRVDHLVVCALAVTRPADSWNRIAPTTRTLLSRLVERGYRLGVISNSNGRLTAHLQRVGLASFFQVIVDSAEVGVEKPHPEIFRIALARAGSAAPEEALHIGDVYAIDVLGAAGAGMNALLLDPTGAWDPAAAPAGLPECRVIGSLEDVWSYLEGRSVRT